MHKMIGYEIRKIFAKKILYIVLPIFIFLGYASDIMDIINDGVGRSNIYYAEKEFINKYGGALTEENYQFIMREYSESEEYYAECEGEERNDKGKFADTRLQDYYILSDIAYQAKYIKEYEKSQVALMTQAEENVKLYQERNDKYKVRENKQICSFYNIKPRLKVIHKDGWFVFEGNKEVLFLLIVVAMFVSTIFSEEQEQNMFPILYTGIRGRKSIAFAKIIAAAIFAFVMTIIFESVRYFLCFLKSGLNDFGEYIQNNATYEYCPFNITFGEMIFLNVLLIALGVVCFSVIVCVISAFCNRNIVALVISVFLIAFIYGNVYRLMYLPSTIGIGAPEVTSDSFVRYFDFNEKYMIAGLLEPQRFFNGYHPVNFLGYPVVSIATNLGVTVLKIAFFVVLTVLAYTKKKYYSNHFAVNNIVSFHRNRERRTSI